MNDIRVRIRSFLHTKQCPCAVGEIEEAVGLDPAILRVELDRLCRAGFIEEIGEDYFVCRHEEDHAIALHIAVSDIVHA